MRVITIARIFVDSARIARRRIDANLYGNTMTGFGRVTWHVAACSRGTPIRTFHNPRIFANETVENRNPKVCPLAGIIFLALQVHVAAPLCIYTIAANERIRFGN